ncbi:MAG: MoaD/ThiS family protein [Pseudomonadota bacterium]
MVIEVKLYLSLLRHVPDSERRLERDKWEVPERSTVGQVLEMLNLPENEAKILLINGKHTYRGKTLNEGDVLQVVPPLCGG